MHKSIPVDIPAHVPESLVFDFDYLAEDDMERDVRGSFLKLKGGNPIIFTPRNEGHWIATTHELIKEILSTPEIFSSYPGQIPKSASGPMAFPFNQMDPPDHGKYRRLLAPLTSAKTIASITDNARELMVEIIEELLPAGRCDFCSEVAEVFPVSIIMKWLALPFEDRFALMKMVDEVIGPFDIDTKHAAMGALFEYVMAVATERRGEEGDDLITHLVNSKIDGRDVEEFDAVTMITTLILGGLDTVRMSMSFFTKFLAENESHRKQLIKNPELIGGAVEELTRWHSIPSIGRNVAKDINFHGVEMKAGDMILCPLILAGVDDDVYESAEVVDFNRKIKALPSYSTGPHFCPGAHLARIELRIFLEEWLKRIPEFSIANNADVVTVGGVTMGVRRLPIVWA